MSNLATIQTAIRTATGITDPGEWTQEAPQPTSRTGVQRVVYWAQPVVDDVGVLTQIPIYVRDLGGGSEEAWTEYYLIETDQQRFHRLALEWCAARVAAGWFVNITHWGEECALGWGISETGAIRTAKLIWETSEKLAVLAILDVPVPGVPTASLATKVVLDPASTELDFAGGYVKQLAVNSTRTLTSTIPPSGQEVYLVIVASGTTNRTVTFGDGFGRVQGTLATGTVNGIVYIVQFISDGTQLHETGRTAGMAA